MAQEINGNFEWPCEKRIAHKPHDDCPGVRAHPNTMIGRPQRPDPDELTKERFSTTSDWFTRKG